MFSLFWKLIADYRVTADRFGLNVFLQSKAINILLSDRYHRLFKRECSALQELFKYTLLKKRNTLLAFTQIDTHTQLLVLSSTFFWYYTGWIYLSCLSFLFINTILWLLLIFARLRLHENDDKAFVNDGFLLVCMHINAALWWCNLCNAKWFLIFQVGCSLRQAALITSLGFITLEVDNQRRYQSWSLTLYVMRLFAFCDYLHLNKHTCNLDLEKVRGRTCWYFFCTNDPSLNLVCDLF